MNKLAVNYMQCRDLTDEEWMQLPKEEILQLYKNCYEMLMEYIKLAGDIEDDMDIVIKENK